jgi:hypothetical protein
VRSEGHKQRVGILRDGTHTQKKDCLTEPVGGLPSVDEYLDASNRDRARALHTLAMRLETYGFDGGYLFTEHSLRMLAADTQERRERDKETIEAWYRAQDRDRAMKVEGAKERLLATLGACS